jgi:secondary thiamine-phosphate synthase enzyme
MTAHNFTFQVQTTGFSDVHDITSRVNDVLRKVKLSDGIVTVFVPGSTAGVTTIEFESGAIEDLKKAIERLAPQGIHYGHDARWGDGNGFAHVRAALLGPSVSVPLVGGKLQLGTWQQVVLIDFDNRPRTREVIVQAIGE